MFNIVPMQFVVASPMAPRIAERMAIVTFKMVFQSMFLFCSIAGAKLLTISDMAKKKFQRDAGGLMLHQPGHTPSITDFHGAFTEHSGRNHHHPWGVAPWCGGGGNAAPAAMMSGGCCKIDDGRGLLGHHH
jgi:hypothetical protein